MDRFLGKVVRIYPGDAYKKYGRLLSYEKDGVVFEIVKSEEVRYKEGDRVFISYAAGLMFSMEASWEQED